MSDRRIAITTPEGRITLTGSRTEVFNNFFPGWELFWFSLDSPYHGKGLGSILFGPRIDPERGNIALPLAFLAAKRFSPLMLLRATTWRLFDFVRGVDALIWTVVLATAPRSRRHPGVPCRTKSGKGCAGRLRQTP